MYSVIRRFLFQCDPEQSHYIALNALQIAYRLGLTRFLANKISKPRTVMGLVFSNPIGLAAGLDKNGDYVDALASLGFGFIEIGTVTPKPQEGNPKPRLFRLPQQQAIINRLGFNGKGVDYVAKKLETIKYRGILGINIGKNKDTPNENAIEDYLIGFRNLWKFASYMTINISSPNTQGLRDLQKSDALSSLLNRLKQEQKTIAINYEKYVPLVVKIAPDMSPQEIHDVAQIVLEQKIDGIIATNTTIHREGLENISLAQEIGGLSGKPLRERSTHTIQLLQHQLQNQVPIIGVGGIMNEEDAIEKLTAGANLLQIYTGFIYEGPNLIKRLVKIV